MTRFPKPWFRKPRGVWYVELAGKQLNLGPDREAAFREYHRLMALPAWEHSLSGREAPLLVEILDRFLDWTNRHRAPATYRWYQERLQQFLNSAGTSLLATELRPYHVQAWLDDHDDWSDGHRRGCITTVQRAMRWAVKMGHLDAAPVTSMEKPAAGKRDDYVTVPEFDALLGHVRDEAFRGLLLVHWDTGCRPQESLRVESRHVERQHRRWVFPPREAKVKSRPRIVYLTERAFEITTGAMEKHPAGPLLRNLRGKPWTPFAVNCRFERLKKKLGRKIGLYVLRHSFATRLLEQGVDPLTVAILLGHANPAMLSVTNQHLAHNPDLLRARLESCMNLPVLMAGSEQTATPPAKSFDPRTIDWSDQRSGVSFVLSDGDNV